MAAGIGKVSLSRGRNRLDARQMAGQLAMLVLFALIAIAVGTTAYAGWQGNWLEALQTTKDVAMFTLMQATLSLALSLLLALPVALSLDYFPTFFGRRFILLLFTIPLSLPVIVAVMAILTLLGRNGFAAQIVQLMNYNWQPDVYGLTGILIAHVFFNMPLAVRIMLQSLEAIPQAHWKLAESLQFGVIERIALLQWPALRVILPNLAGLIFLLCLGSYAVILVLGGGPQTTTIQVAIYQALSFDFDLSRAAVLTLAQLTLSFLLLVALPTAPAAAIQAVSKPGRRYHKTTMWAGALSILFIVSATLYIALPLGAVAVSGLSSDHIKLLTDRLFWQALTTSLVIGTASALLAVTAAWSISAAQYSYEMQHRSFLFALFRTTPLALMAAPSLVLGVGWFLFAVKTGLPLTFAPLLVVLANTLLALPFAMQIIQPVLKNSFHRNDRLASSLGVKGLMRLLLIDLPVMRPALASAALFAFALSLGDLGVVTLFGSDQILTLPALIFQKMGSYRSNDAAALALYLALFTGLITFLALRVTSHAKT